MRIAYICADPGVPVYGRKGCSVHVQEVIRAMLGTGARVDLFASRVDGETPPGLEGATLHRLPALPKRNPAERERAAFCTNDDLRQSLTAAGPFDLIYERYSLWSYSGMHHAAANGLPGVLEVNAPLIEEQAEHRVLVHHDRALAVARSVFSGATAVVAVSAQVADYVRGLGAAADRVHVIPNGVNVERFDPSVPAALPADAGVFTVGFTGTLKPWHGLPVLIEAFALLHEQEPRTRLLLVGDGSERERIERDVAERGLTTAVQFTGAVDPGAVPGLLTSMDVAVAPYPDLPDFYFSPLKLYEYMAAGLPVVASRIGQITDVIVDGQNGLLCEAGDPAALASACLKLLRDESLRHALGQAARASVLEERTWQAVVQRVLELAEIDTHVGMTA